MHATGGYIVQQQGAASSLAADCAGESEMAGAFKREDLSGAGIVAAAAVVLLVMAAGAFWVLKPPQSPLFAVLRSLSEAPNATGPFDLLNDGIWQADAAIDRLLDDGFVPENYFSSGQSLSLCGLYTLPVNKPIRFVREGTVLRLEKYTYEISMVIDDTCFITSAIGRTGLVPMP
jgi:hypothetical protein